MYLICHLKFQNEAKIIVPEKVLLFLIMFYLLEQNRRLTLYRLLLYSFLLQRMRILVMQRVAVQHFTTLYHSQRAWVYHRRENDLADYLANDEQFQVNPNYWHSNFRMSQEPFLFLCNTLHGSIRKVAISNLPSCNVTGLVEYHLKCKMIHLVGSSGLGGMQLMFYIKLSN